MNLVPPFLWKEWRAQRGILVAYTLLVFTCLCLGLLLAPTHASFEEGFGAHALSWFVVAGVIGVVAFVAPSLVRAEFGPKDDQFVRRLPSALWPSLGGELLLLLLAMVSLPLLGLSVGEAFVTLRGHDWSGLFGWTWDGQVTLQWSLTVLGCGAAMLLVPWVWAIGTWMPGGRMALGGTALFLLLLGVAVFAVFRQCPGLQLRLAWQGWLSAMVPLGLAVAAAW